MFARQTQSTEPKAKAKGNTWFPSTKTAKGAAEAAKQGAFAYFGLTAGYLMADLLLAAFNFNPMQLQAGPVTMVVNAVIAALAAGLGWLALRKPGLIKAVAVLLWAILELVGKVDVLKSANVGAYWLNILIVLWAINGVRGALALRKPLPDAEAQAAA